MFLSSVEEELRRLIDLEAIRDLARRYARCVWQSDILATVDLFTEDGEMHTGERPPIVGREDLLRVYGEMVEGYMLNPFVHSHIVELDGDEATGTCYLDLLLIRDGTQGIDVIDFKFDGPGVLWFSMVSALHSHDVMSWSVSLQVCS